MSKTTASSLMGQARGYYDKLPQQSVERIGICAVTGTVGGLVLRGVHPLSGLVFLPLGYVFSRAISSLFTGTSKESETEEEEPSTKNTLKGRVNAYLIGMCVAYVATTLVTSGLTIPGALVLSVVALPILALGGVETIAKMVKLTIVYAKLTAENREKLIAEMKEYFKEQEFSKVSEQIEEFLAMANSKLQALIDAPRS